MKDHTTYISAHQKLTWISLSRLKLFCKSYSFNKYREKFVGWIGISYMGGFGLDIRNAKWYARTYLKRQVHVQRKRMHSVGREGGMSLKSLFLPGAVEIKGRGHRGGEFEVGLEVMEWSAPEPWRGASGKERLQQVTRVERLEAPEGTTCRSLDVWSWGLETGHECWQRPRNLRVLFLFLVFIQEEQGTRTGPGWRAMEPEGPTSVLNIPRNIWHLKKPPTTR